MIGNLVNQLGIVIFSKIPDYFIVAWNWVSGDIPRGNRTKPNASVTMIKMIRMKNESEFSAANEFRTDRKFCDVVIKVGDRSFPCHRVILAATTQYFHIMFGGDYVETENKEVELGGVNADDFEQLLTFVYGSEIAVSGSNVLRLFEIAHYLGLQSLEDSCVEYVAENSARISSDTLSGIFGFASATGNAALVDALAKSTAENFVRLSHSAALYRITGNDLRKILFHPDLEHDNIAILDFLMEWVKVQPDKERKLLPEILAAVRLQEESKNWILKTLTNTQSSTVENDARDVDLELLPADAKVDDVESEDATRLPFLFITHDFSKSGKKYHVDAYKFRGVNEIEVSGSPLIREVGDVEDFQCKSFLMNDTQFTLRSGWVQGEGSTRRRGTLDLYAKNSFDDIGALNCYKGREINEAVIGEDYDRGIFTAALNGTDIFVYNNIDFLVYASERNVWHRISGYESIFAPNMLSHGNSLYMAGGFNIGLKNPIISKYTQYTVSNVDVVSENPGDGKLLKRYDIRDNTWSQLRNMKYARCKAASCVYNNTIYVSGGDNLTYHNNYKVEFYDIRAAVWGEFATPMPKAKMGHCLVAFNDRLWFFGGRIPGRSGKFDPTWFSYNLEENTWSEIFSLPTKNGRKRIRRILDVLVEDEN